MADPAQMISAIFAPECLPSKKAGAARLKKPASHAWRRARQASTKTQLPSHSCLHHKWTPCGQPVRRA